MPALIRVLFGSLFTFACAWSLGRLIGRKLDLSWPLTIGVGAVLLSSLVLGLMAAGLAKPLGLAALGVVCLAPIAFIGLGKARAPAMPKLVWIILIAYTCFYAVHALAPEIQADANSYHLVPAVEAKQAGGFASPISFYDCLPQGMEMLFAFAYAFGGSSAAKVVHFGFLLASIPLIVELGTALGFAAECSAIAAGLYFCAPVVGVSGTSAYNDVALVFYTLATIVLLLKHRTPMGFLLAGLAAGFCYSIKMTGLLVPLLGCGYLVVTRQWRGAVLFCAAAGAIMAPWLLRNAVEVGNPFAPLANGLFPNQFFHWMTERRLSATLRNYGQVRWSAIPLEVTTFGERLQGLIGPVFLLAPIALLGLRRRAGVVALGLGALLAIPWLLNTGTRFLMPALPLIALAMVLPLHRIAAYALLVIQAVTCWPMLVDLYAPGAWRLTGFPIAAALRIESEPDYLKRVSFDYRVAKMIEAQTPPGAKIMDLAGAQQALTDRELLGYWQSAAGDRLYAGLEMASLLDRGVVSEIRSMFPEQPIRKIHVRQTVATKGPWSIHEVELYRGDVLIGNSRRWTIDAWPNLWESPLALDHNLVSRWTTDQPARPGMFWELDFDRPQLLSQVNIIVANTEQQGRIEVYAQKADQEWMDVSAAPEARPAVNLRRTAIQLLRHHGFRYILVRLSQDRTAWLGEVLLNQASDWGIEYAARYENIYLLRIP